MFEYTMVGNYCNCLKIHVDKGHGGAMVGLQ